VTEDQPTFPLFCYGTLQEPEVQLALFGRIVPGEPDTLRGFGEVPVTIEGESYWTLYPTRKGAVEGVVLWLTEEELRLADAYEDSSHYVRVELDLQSGLEAFVYIAAEC
jgi:gamma-glutamylcyclotransferase (GGCT)/AIG2-like uncharacterized protein YtfP